MKQGTSNNFSTISNNNSENINEKMPTVIINYQHERKELHKTDNIAKKLTKHVPSQFQLGSAIVQGDCFFDAVAQAFNQFTQI
jgi:hypothetical protein